MGLCSEVLQIFCCQYEAVAEAVYKKIWTADKAVHRVLNKFTGYTEDEFLTHNQVNQHVLHRYQLQGYRIFLLEKLHALRVYFPEV